MAAVALIWDLIARDSASATFTKVGTAAETNSAKVGKFVGALGAIALVDAGYHALKMAGDFEQSTNVLVTAAGETVQNLDLIRKGILNIATTTGTDWQKVTDAMYTLEKAGYRGADALKVEMAAAQGAREENASLATVTNAMTSIMASYHLNVSDSVSVMNQLKAAAGESKTTMELFAGSLSTVLPVASANKISFADVAGSLATLTQHGTTADEATQELSNTIRNLSAPNAVAVKQMAQLGISSVDVAEKLGDGPGGRGLAGTLNYLSQTVLSKMGPSGTVLLNTFNQSKTAAAAAKTEFDALPPAAKKVAQAYLDGTLTYKEFRTSTGGLSAEQANLARQWATTQNNAVGFQSVLKNGLAQNETYTQAIKAMTGGANGLNTTLQITGESMDGTNERIKVVADAAKGAGKDVSGWDSTQKLFNVQMDKFKQSAEAAGIEIGTKLIPFFASAAGWAAKHTTVILELVGAFVAYKAAVIAVNIVQGLWAAMSAVAAGAMSLIERAAGRSTLALFAFTAEAQAARLAEAGMATEAPLAGAAMSVAFGPVGIAIGVVSAAVGAIAIGLGVFGGKAKEQVKPVQELTQAIIDDGLAIKQLTIEQVNNALSQSGAYEAGRKLGISSSVILANALGDAGAKQQIDDTIKRADQLYESLSRTMSLAERQKGGLDAAKAAKDAADKLAGALGTETGALQASMQAAQDKTRALDLLNVQTGKGSEQVLQLKDKLDKLSTTVAAPTVALSGGNTAIDTLTRLQTVIANINGQQVRIPISAADQTLGLGRATGDPSWRGGTLWAGENGPEEIWLPKGSKINSAQNSKDAPSNDPALLAALQDQTAALTQVVDRLGRSIDTSIQGAAQTQGRTVAQALGAGTSRAFT